MGVDAKWGSFPICPEMSRFVPGCPLLSFLGPGTGTKEDKRGQTGTKRDISGQIGETPPFSIYPHLALFKLRSGLASTINASAWLRGIFLRIEPQRYNPVDLPQLGTPGLAQTRQKGA